MAHCLTIVVRMWRRLVRVYDLEMAHEDVRRLGLRAPGGVWVCPRCELMLWDERAYEAHTPAHQ